MRPRDVAFALSGMGIVIVGIFLTFHDWSGNSSYTIFGLNSGATSSPSVRLTDEIGQTLMIGISSTTLTADDLALMETVHPGGIILFSRNIQSPQQLAQLTTALQAAATQYSSSTLFIAVDEEGGVVSRLPWIRIKTGEPAIADTSTAYEVAAARASTLRDLGINVDLAPVLDAALPRDFLYDRTFQQPETLAGELGEAMIEGYSANGILATMKHFPGYVGIAGDPEQSLHSVPLPTITQFTIAAQANPAFVMVANVEYPSLDPAAPFPLSSIDIAYLHAHVPGNYLVITDDLSDHTMRTNYGVGPAVLRAMEAGVDMELVGSGAPSDTMAAYDSILNGIQNGAVPSSTITGEYEKIMTIKSRL